MKGSIIDKLEIIREIGRGGFGVVYLAQGDDGQYFALKSVLVDSPKYFNKELKALEIYKKFSQNNKTDNLVKIIDIKISDSKIEYLMPLADGVGGESALDENWKPMTLTALVNDRYSKGKSFTTKELLEIFEPIFDSVQKLNENGIAHRDIKPDNIIFINGKAHLADIGLLREDTYTISSAGTPVYSPPSWYTNTGGKADMWGLATTLYFFLSGNSPDTMGRLNYMYPPSKDSMSKEDILAWEHFHRVALRANRERANERYITFADFSYSLKNINDKNEKIDFGDLDVTSKSTSIFWIKGRISRGYFAIFFIVLQVVTSVIGSLTDYINEISQMFYLIICACLICLNISIEVKRVHDAGHSALIAFVIHISSIFLRLLNPFFVNISEESSISQLLSCMVYDYSITVALFVIFLSFKSEKSIEFHCNSKGKRNL